MRTSPLVVAVATALLGAGCDSSSKSSTATPGPGTSTGADGSTAVSAPARPADYTRLLIRAEDINAPETFTAAPPTRDPDGKTGVATTYSNEDGSHVIVDTILIMPDPAAAAAALNTAKAMLPGSARRAPAPVDVGTDGTTVSGDSPDGSKGVTMLRFTEGRAFATLEFDGPPGMAAPPDFVTDVGQQQDAAIKNGLAG